MNYTTNKLSNSFAVEVNGLQLHDNMSVEDIKELENLILENKVVVFRNQNLTPLQQIKVVGQFGQIVPHPLKQNTCPYKEMTYVSNVTSEGEAIGYPGPSFHIWHSDLCYEPVTPKFSFLYAEQVPNMGGNTLFANSTLAYDELDKEIKDELADKLAIFGFSENLMKRCKEKDYDLVIDKVDQKPDYAHPIFREHPLTKKKSIFVNWTHTDSIQGFDKDTSDKYLNLLFDHSTNEKYVYSHKYNKNDLIVWDNSATLHTGDGTIEIDRPRVMRRVVVGF